ncbi:MAG: hypothetical protein V2I33_11595 [Kangiellaceae bacterium]|nr:hypothetical protein [Kangiellaceae bacterium]
MAQLDFYANKSDVLELIDYMFELAPMKLFEAYSLPGNKIREFRSSKDITESSHIDDNHGAIFVRGWWEAVTSAPTVKTFDLDNSVGVFRQVLEGVGTFQLQQGTPNDMADDALDLSCFSHWSEKGAYQRSNYLAKDVSEVDWIELKSLSGKVQRHIRNKMSVATLMRKPILQGAYRYLENGGTLFGRPGLFSVRSSDVKASVPSQA